VFDTRADTTELLDKEDVDETLTLQSYRFMGIVNKFLGGAAMVRDFIANEIRPQNRFEPLKILDIGSGPCDIPAAICLWAQAKGLKLEFTCIETNTYAIQAAQQNMSQYSNIKVVEKDIFNYQPSERYDCATGSLFFHHLSNEQITGLISRLRTFGCRSVLINDLHRSLVCYAGCLFACMFVPAGVRHDALLSIRKGFKPEELRQLLEKMPKTAVSVRTAWFGRVCAIIRFETEDSK
jgi:2-polyprenyl-3-methyl-5-hydroxy-6-metoxy-1,4-benzoquinol methylase